MGHSVLVVDDNATVRKAFRRVFEGGGWTVYEASSGTEALGLLVFRKVDLVTMDYVLPGGGHELLARVRAVSKSPVLLISGLPEEYLDKAGYDDWARKPIGPVELLQKAWALAKRGPVDIQ